MEYSPTFKLKNANGCIQKQIIVCWNCLKWNVLVRAAVSFLHIVFHKKLWKASKRKYYKLVCCVAELLTHYGASSPKFSICHSEAVTGLIRGREQIRIPRLISSLWLSNSAGLCGTNTLQCIRTTWIRAWWRLRIYASNCCGSFWINQGFMSSCLLSNICCYNTEYWICDIRCHLKATNIDKLIKARWPLDFYLRTLQRPWLIWAWPAVCSPWCAWSGRVAPARPAAPHSRAARPRSPGVPACTRSRTRCETQSPGQS